jgi:ABC-type multidrug transport system permease subunit
VSEKPSTLSVIRWLIERDLRTLIKSPFILINRTIFFLIQLFVFAVLVSKLASSLGFNYFDFYSVGAVVSTITSIAFIIGEDLFEEEELGLLDYLLSLPFGHSLFVLGRALGGAVRGLIYVTPMMVLVAYLDGYFSPGGIIGSLLVIFILATGISGLSITLAMLIRNANRFDITIALAELATVRVSAAIYPLMYMPNALQPVAANSPVTSASDLVRAIVLPLSYSSSAYDWVILFLFVGIFFGLGSAFLFRKIEGGKFD